MGNVIPTIPTTTTTDNNVDDGAESPKPSPRTVASFESIRRIAQLKVMSEIEQIIQGVDKTKDINVTNIREAVEKIVKQLSAEASTVNPLQITLDAGDGSLGEGASHQLVKKRDWKFGWGDNFDYDAKDLLRLIHDRIKPDQIKQFTTPALTNDQVNVIKKNMMDIAEDIPEARAAATARVRARDITKGWRVNRDNPGGPLDSPGGGSKKKRRTGKKLNAKQRTTTRALLKKWKKNEIKENNKKIRK